MSIHYLVVIQCDHLYCLRQHRVLLVSPKRLLTEARRKAKQNGWGQNLGVLGKMGDRCPHHVEG